MKQLIKWGSIFLLLSLLVYTGCGPKYVSTTSSHQLDETKVAKLAVIPFVASPEGDQKGLRSAKVEPAGVLLIHGMFVRGVTALGYSAIPIDNIDMETISSQGIIPQDIIKSISDRTGADAVLTGIVTRFEEREGGPVGIRKPASVGFEVKLISTVDGAILWSGRYAETQKSLLEDLSMFFAFMQRGWKWLSAEELARYGVDEVLRNLPEARR